jgi:hypothetical protein
MIVLPTLEVDNLENPWILANNRWVFPIIYNNYGLSHGY